jgi:hypothetical protein
VQLIKQVEQGSIIKYITDNKALHDSFNKGPKHCNRCSNADLYYELFHLTYQGGIILNTRWMPSHLSESDPLPEGVSLVDLKGNKEADRLAGLAAKELQVPSHISTDIIYYYKLTAKIQRRLVTVIINLPARVRKQTVRSKRELVTSIEELVSHSSHDLKSVNGRFTCSRCMSSFKQTDPAFRDWVSCKCCAAVAIESQVPMNLEPSSALHIGNQQVHYTHRLKMFKGFMYCKKCGCIRGSNQVRKLAKPCLPPTPYGVRTLRSVHEGRLPQHFMRTFGYHD